MPSARADCFIMLTSSLKPTVWRVAKSGLLFLGYFDICLIAVRLLFNICLIWLRLRLQRRLLCITPSNVILLASSLEPSVWRVAYSGLYFRIYLVRLWVQHLLLCMEFFLQTRVDE